MKEHYLKSKGLHLNYEIISEMIEENSHVLDLGCGNGELLKRLITKKNVKGIGIEINQDEVIASLEKGLSVVQGDIDTGLKEFKDKSYDYVILNQTLQTTHNPELVLKEMLRVGKKCVVSFPNFAYWRVRFHLFFKGEMPKSRILPFEWYNTPNIHLLTVNDFFEFAKIHNIKILKSIYMSKAQIKKFPLTKSLPNLFAEEVIFVISREIN